jgi:CheY-like chemotaxis protein
MFHASTSSLRSRGEPWTARHGTVQPVDGSARRPTGKARQLVLVVEDEAHHREIYGNILGYNGFDVIFAASGREALGVVREHVPALVVLDFGLPDLHGIELCRSLRREPGMAEVPILALTGLAERQYGDLARLAGCTEYLEKPARPVTVLHKVERLIGKAPLPGEGRPPRITGPAD